MAKRIGKEATRRDFARAGVAFGLGPAILSLPDACAQSTGGSGASGVVDQNPIRRRGIGFRALNAAKASPGLTLFAPLEGDGTVYLIDLSGKVVHTWKMPYPPGLYGYLTDKGTLFYNGKIPNDGIIGRTPFKGGAALEADWNGKVLWEVRHPDHHHDGRLLPNGNVMLLCGKALPEDVAKKVRGGLPGSGRKDGRMVGDYLVEMTKDGRIVWEWRSWEHLDPATDIITAVQDGRGEWTHGNAVHELPDGNLLVSFRNISTIVKVDRKSGDIVWKLGAPPLSGQHAPTPLANGNILIFDNGPHRLDQGDTFSRVIEVNPATKEIVWKFQEPTATGFYSPRISNARRLPNGNTLICEGVFGRFFEVTAEGETVWEYVNPHFGPASDPPAKQQNDVFRVYRYTEEEIEKARTAL